MQGTRTHTPGRHVPAASNLNAAVAAMNASAGPDAAVQELVFELNGHNTVVPSVYLEPLLPSDRLMRGPAAQLLDTAARACADAHGLGTRLAVVTAHRLRSEFAFQRLGYRTDADYAREELRITPRAFRDLARLGERLEALPEVRRAFLDGDVTRTQAEVIAGVASPSDQDEWLSVAKHETVRGLKATARRARQRPNAETHATERAAASSAAGNPAAHSETSARRRSFEVPPSMRGKIDAVLQFAARVAGADLPPGALWELIAAEFLSGVSSESVEAVGDVTQPLVGEATPELDETSGALPLGRQHPPEDPRGYQIWLEQETRLWAWLPSTRPRLEPRGDWQRLRERCADDAPRSPRQLHDDMTAALTAERRVAWQLGRLLGMIRNRNLWRDLWFASFAHYVRERIGISPRTADRLIRIDRDAWSFPALRRAWDGGELAPLQAEALVRVLRRVGADEELQQIWIDFARHTTFEHFAKVVRAADRLWTDLDPLERRAMGKPEAVERALAAERMPAADRTPAAERVPASDLTAGDGAVSRTGHIGAKGPETETSPMFVSRYDVWMTDGEFEMLQRALDAVAASLLFPDATAFTPPLDRGGGAEAGARQGPSGGDCRGAPAHTWERPAFPAFVCLDLLLDAFVCSYEELASRMRDSYPLFERDGWRCRTPGCSAHGPLHLHHIVFRAHGGGNEEDNLVTLCARHHEALHKGWIRCCGRASQALYWELGVNCYDGAGRAPVARFVGTRRLAEREYWDGVHVRPL